MAHQLAGHREASGPPQLSWTARHPIPSKTWGVIEWRGALGALCREAGRLGAVMWMLPPSKGPQPGHLAWPVGVGLYDRTSAVQAVVASLTNDEGEEAACWTDFVVGSRGTDAIADAPQTANLEPAFQRLQAAGFAVATKEILTSDLGDAVARKRVILTASLGREPPAFEAAGAAKGGSIDHCVPSKGSAKPAAWLEPGELRLDPRLPKPGGELGARPCGHWCDGDRRITVYSGDAPAPSLRAKMFDEGTGEPLLVFSPKGPSQGVWRIAREDAWVLQGHDRSAWRRMIQEGESEERLWGLGPARGDTEVVSSDGSLHWPSGGKHGYCEVWRLFIAA